MPKKCFLFSILSVMFLSGCATYHISTESFLRQFWESERKEIICFSFVGGTQFIFFPNPRARIQPAYSYCIGRTRTKMQNPCDAYHQCSDHL